MAEVKKRKTKGSFAVLEKQCLGNECFQPGEFQVRGATPSGSRNTGQTTLCCMRRAYHGCPDQNDRGFSKALLAERKKEGWK